jgi:hypothetical protein
VQDFCDWFLVVWARITDSESGYVIFGDKLLFEYLTQSFKSIIAPPPIAIDASDEDLLNHITQFSLVQKPLKKLKAKEVKQIRFP